MHHKNRVREFFLLPDEGETRLECTNCEEQFDEEEISNQVTIFEEARTAVGFCPNCS